MSVRLSSILKRYAAMTYMIYILRDLVNLTISRKYMYICGSMAVMSVAREYI